MSDKSVTELNSGDWGFTFIDPKDISDVQLARDALKNSQETIDQLHKMMLNFLTSLEASPEKEYIHWPNRVQDIRKFMTKIEEFVKKA